MRKCILILSLSLVNILYCLEEFQEDCDYDDYYWYDDIELVEHLFDNKDEITPEYFKNNYLTWQNLTECDSRLGDLVDCLSHQDPLEFSKNSAERHRKRTVITWSILNRHNPLSFQELLKKIQ